MGVRYGPEDLLKGRKERLKKGLRDLHPGLRDIGRRMIDFFEDQKKREKALIILRSNPDDFEGLSFEEACEKLRTKYGF